jgi:anti-sigma factor RsiW
MAEIQRIKDLEIAEDFDYQKRSWIVQRVGWAVMGLLTLAGLLGVFGPGLLGEAKAGKPSDRLWIEYERFERFQSPGQLRVHLQPGSEQAGQVRIRLNRDYLEQVQIQQVTPQPIRVEAKRDHLVYVFQTAKIDRTTAVTFYFQPQQIGSVSGSVGLETGQALSFSQFIYP